MRGFIGNCPKWKKKNPKHKQRNTFKPERYDLEAAVV